MAEERVVVVDENNEVIGAQTRSFVRAQHLCHREVFVFVFNSRGELHIQERTMTKDVYPGCYDLAVGGVVDEGEEYDEAAARELKEEFGIAGIKLTPRFHFYYQDSACRLWGKAYTCLWEGKIVPQPEEVADVIMDRPEHVLANTDFRPYTPDSLLALKKLMELNQ
ncbi:NUDIX domain-containing protein [Sansalvadorimonas sp. 2012CJ34-2]|uniref:NUDIX domain-containing protein n=1 Tax=Parendozoicomonas callyspongiae TaxID=2942213 RepID=A0ABT0PJF1_9GAMM|nr:NUDIX domain-containing protein [Sansalvadorimonas sp. 2012CJ34-2]MCL6271509.1 NUDIX domain-containing protein [Sansalvadorimonas sp. 2012CJ34-2]